VYKAKKILAISLITSFFLAGLLYHTLIGF